MPWHWWNQDASKGLITFSFPPLLSWILSPSQTTLLIKGTRCGSCLSLSSKFQFPAGTWNYSNKLIASSCGNHGSPCPLGTTPGGALGCCVQLLCGSAWHVVSSTRRLYLLLRYHYWSHPPSDSCLVFSHHITLGWGFLPHQRDGQEAIKTNTVYVSRIDNNLVGFPYSLSSCMNLSTLSVRFLFLAKHLLGASDLLQFGLVDNYVTFFEIEHICKCYSPTW